ncbi:MAG: type VI secretion system domain-containing protein, partial [Myxococcales bacterium]
MRDKLRVLPELTPPPVASTAPAPPTAVPQASAPAQRPADRPRPAEPVRVVDRADLGRVLEASAKTLQDAAETMRRADPARPLAYRVQRLALWLDLEDAPPTEDGLTRLPPPDDRDRTLLDTLMAAASWTDLLRRAEELTGQYLFWFDLHWMVALAMERLGAVFLPARDEVGRELVMLLMRFPTLAGLRFSDGTAFARPQAVAWLEGEQKKLGAGGGSGPSAASAEDDEVTRRFDEARELVSGGKTAEGLALAMALSQRGADARVRFRSRLTVARLAMD